MKKKKIISIFIIIIAVLSLLVVIELALHPHGYIFSPTLPAGTYQGTLSSVSPPRLAQAGKETLPSLVWGITVSDSVYSGLSLPNGTIIYIVSSSNTTSYSNFITDLASSVSDGLSNPTFDHGPEVVSFSGTIFTFKDNNDHLCHGLYDAKLMPPVPQPM